VDFSCLGLLAAVAGLQLGEKKAVAAVDPLPPLTRVGEGGVARDREGELLTICIAQAE
jgi:hypothetical protein